MRPTIVCVFDNVTSEIILVTPARKRANQSAAQAYEAAQARLERMLRALDKPLPRQHAPMPPAEAMPAQVSNTTPEQYRALVAHCKDYCREGDIFQVVPSQRFTAPLAAAAFALYRSLRRLNPSPFLFYLNFAAFSVVGSSPEILVRLRDGVVTIRPIAGTRPRGATPAEDHALEEELLADPKERAEHLMLVDLGRNDVGRVAETGSVTVTDQFFIERYSHVMHIVSNVEGNVRSGCDAIDALAAGFPAGTLSGAPKVRAMEIINELEKEKRGVYAGAVGYFAANGTMDTCIVLRTAILKDGVMYVQAGGGVVADSDPEAEFQETVNKAKALFAAADEAVRYASMANYRK
jgi:anthranilate synthase component 1